MNTTDSTSSSNNVSTSNEATPLLRPIPSTHIIHGDDPPSQSQSASVAVSSLYRSRRISWENYVVAVEKYPIRTKCMTAWIIFVAADTFAQVIQHILSFMNDHSIHITTCLNIDCIRAMRFGALGLFGAPWSHYYFHWLDHYLPPSEEPFTKRTALKVCIDQFLQAPILLAIMIFSLSLMKGQGFGGAKQDLENTFMISLIANWKLWIPASIVNIAFVQPSLRVLFVNVVFFFWTIILSLMLNQST